MTRAEFISYKKAFVGAARQVLATSRSAVLSEAAFPAYANRNPLISFLFWQRVRKVMRHLEAGECSGNAMDFGCGGGVMLPFLGQHFQHVTALDIDLSPFKKMAGYVKFPGNLDIFESAIRPLNSFAAGSFSAILALDVLEHVADLPGTVSDLCRLLAPKGKLLVSVPTENFAYRIGRKIAGAEYSGDYHMRNSDQIEKCLSTQLKLSRIATLYYPMPLFEIYCGEKRDITTLAE